MLHLLLPAVISIGLLASVFVFAWIADLRAVRRRRLARAEESAAGAVVRIDRAFRGSMASPSSGRMMRSITAPTASKALEIWLSHQPR